MGKREDAASDPGDHRSGVEIRPLEQFDPEGFVEIASGYTTQQCYVVRRDESDAATVFRIEIEELASPRVKQWESDAEDLQWYGRLVPEQGLSLGAYRDERPVGVAICERQAWNRTLWVREFHVHTDCRGQGIGRALMEAVVELARRQSLQTICCETQNTNVPAIRFYRRLGFELDGLDLSLYPREIDEVAFFMKRRIDETPL